MRALCVLHDAFSTTGLIGEALRARGWQVDEILVVPADRHDAPNVDFTFPDHRDYDLLVPMGAPWAAYGDDEIGRWLTPELDWLSGAVADGGAVFGICFGGQALARALGGSVARSQHPEIGWVTVEVAASNGHGREHRHSAAPAPAPGAALAPGTGDSVIVPGPWFQWHFDTFTPPPGATILARNAAAVQAYRIGRCLGVQFHPEVTAADIKLWLGNGGENEALGQGADPADLLAEAERQLPAARARAGALIDNYLSKIFAA